MIGVVAEWRADNEIAEIVAIYASAELIAEIVNTGSTVTR